MATTDGFITISSPFEDAESELKHDVLVSPDDVAWADSCLTNNPETSEPNMDSLKEALLELISYHSEPLETSEGIRQGSSVEISPATEERDTPTNIEIDVDAVPFTEAAENIDEDHPLEEKTDVPASTSYFAKAFLPTYKGEMIEIRYSSDSDVDLGFPEFAMESASEDIFKVWDLGLPVEEDLLTKQLNKALADSSLKKVLSTFDGSEAGKGFEDDSIDDLVAGIADMSLQKRSN